ncbi:MAG: SprT-like domain-containing protein [Anaerovoracaceae bacterium]
MEKEKIDEYLQEVIRQAQSLGIPVSKNICPTVNVNSRAKKRFGGCKSERQRLKTIYTIELSQDIIKCDSKIVKKILAHEVLHTCTDCHNHGPKWKAYGQQMERAYGYEIKRTSSYEDFGMPPPEKEGTGKYQFTCEKCGQNFYRQRKSRLVTHTKEYRCMCGGKLNFTKKA